MASCRRCRVSGLSVHSAHAWAPPRIHFTGRPKLVLNFPPTLTCPAPAAPPPPAFTSPPCAHQVITEKLDYHSVESLLLLALGPAIRGKKVLV